MPPNHQQYLQWNGDRFRKWAKKIGQNTSAVVESILTGYKVEQQGYRACMALLKLSDKYTLGIGLRKVPLLHSTPKLQIHPDNSKIRNRQGG